MPYLNFSRPFNAQNLTNKELADLIKNNEFYSGCYSIIQEKNLRGIDILNLTENSLAAWKLPQWLTKKLLSLKETLTKNPGSLSIEEDENLGDDPDPRKTISNSLTTLFKNKQKPKFPVRKISDEHSPIRKEPDIDLIYDDDNYLKPQFNSTNKRPNHETRFNNKSNLLIRESSRKNHDVSAISARKPIALPRPDEDEEENEYEPAPTNRAKVKKTISKLPLPPPPEETDEYEPPPRFKQTEPPPEEAYEYIDTKEKDRAKASETQNTKFYIDINEDLPPPLPERSFTRKIQAPKFSFNPVYTNVEDIDRSPTGSTTSSTKNRIGKIGPKVIKAISPVAAVPKNSDPKLTWSASSRPLPPLPSPSPGGPALNAGAASRTIKSEDEESAYENTNEAEAETLGEYGNITETTNVPSKPNKFSEPKSRTSKDHINDLRSQLTKVRLKPSHPVKSKVPNFHVESKELKEKFEKVHGNRESKEVPNFIKTKKEIISLKSSMKLPLPPTSVPQNVQTYFDDVLDKRNGGSDFGGDSDENSEDDQPEYLNTADSKNKPSASRSYSKTQVTSPISDIARQISQKTLKPVSAKRELAEKFGAAPRRQPIIIAEEQPVLKNESESDSENEQDLPEYLNADSQTTETAPLKIEHPTQPISDLSTQLAKVILKPTTPKKNIHLNDTLADELRLLLEKRKGSNENIEPVRAPKDSSPRSKPIQKSPSYNPPTESDDFDENDLEDYDVAGSYNNMFNFNNEPFYRNTDRKGAIALLSDLDDGAFLLRPSSKFFLSITIKNNEKYFNLGIEKTQNNKIFSGEGTMRTKEFISLKQFLEYFEHNPLILQGDRGLEEVYLKKILPLDRF